MNIRKLQPIGEGSAALCLPKDDLRDMGIVDDDGDIIDAFGKIEKSGERQFTVELIED